MSDPREPSDPDSTEKTPATPGEPAPSMPPFPSAPPAPPVPPAPTYGAPSVYGTPASTSSSAPPPVYGPRPTPAGAPPSGQLPYTNPYAPGQIPPSRGGWMSIVSLILGGLALLVCWVPFLNVVTVFGAIGGLVLGLIALFRKFGSRALSLTGTIVSAVAFILSVVLIVIYTVSFVSAIDSAPDYDDSPSTSKPYSDPSETDSPDDESYPGDPTAVPGDPTPSAGATVCAAGTAIGFGKAGIFTYDDENQAEVTISDVKLNATDEMLNAYSFNDTPPDGYQYAIFSLTIKQLGADEFPAGATRAIFSGVADDIASSADIAVPPEPQLIFAPDLMPGESVTGNIAVYVPTSGAETGSLLLRNYLADNVCEMKVG
ncbi:DUF4190 domain-containing protein [Agreia bicolorata]|nr:DUF4190 domain-containing protein [Agreia bicolorata]